MAYPAYACPGPCNRGARDAWQAYEEALAAYDPLDPGQSRPEPPTLPPWPGEPIWCPPCAARISQRLSELDDLASLLARYADGHREAPTSPLLHASAAAMSPSQAADTAEDLAQMLGGWEKAYRDLRNWPAPHRTGDLAEWITTCSAWLAARLTRILASPIGEDFGREILQWHRSLEDEAKAGTRKLIKPLRCPSPACQQLSLKWEEGAEDVRCGNPDCRLVMRYSEYEAEVQRAAGDAKAGPGAA